MWRSRKSIDATAEVNDENFEIQLGIEAFRHYHELGKRRFELEAQQAVCFLVRQRVEGDVNENEELVAPTQTRSLGEDFSLQL